MNTSRIPSNSATRWRRGLRLLVWLYPCLLCGVLALSIVTVLPANNTFSKVSCDCSGLISFSDEISDSQSIFVGKVVSAQPGVGAKDGTIKFQVLSAWKGVTQTNYLMSWPGLWTVCDPRPKVDEQWLVYAEPLQDGHAVMSPCGRSALLSTEAAQADIKALGQANEVPPPTRDGQAFATEKVQFAIDTESTRTAKLTAIATLPTHPPSTLVPYQTPVPLPIGIRASPHLGAHVCDCVFLNAWRGVQNGWYLNAYAGYREFDVDQGLIMLDSQTLDGHTTTLDFFTTPSRDGSLRIMSADGLRVTILSSNNTQYIFDAGLRAWISPSGTPVPAPTIQP